jgi:hypothetical protein
MTLGIVLGGEAKIIPKAMHFDVTIYAAELCNNYYMVFNTPLFQLIIICAIM